MSSQPILARGFARGRGTMLNPNYYIHDEGANRFFITVNRDTASAGAERISNVKEAPTIVAKAEGKRLRWEKWALNYI
jgi:hypothetical protein